MTASGSDTNTDSYTTASISPGANRLVMAAVYSRFNSSGNVPTLTGNGITWVPVITQRTSDNILRMTIFRGLVVGPSAGTVTIDFAAQTQEFCVWIISEFTGVDTGGVDGSGAIVQSVGNRDEATNTGLTVTLAAFAAAANAAYGAVRAGNTISPGSGFSEIAEVTAATEAPYVQAEWALNDTTVDWSWASSGSFAVGAAAEIRAGGSATATYIGGTGSAADSNTYTFSTFAIGPALAGRKIAVAVSGRESGGGGVTLDSATIGGVSATINVQVTNSGNLQAIIIASVPTGTTADIVVNFSSTMGNADIDVYYVTGVGSNTATDTGTSTANVGTYDLDVVAGGIAIAMMKNDNGSHTATWAGVGESYDDADAATNDISGGCRSFLATQTNLTVSCTWSGTPTRPVFAVASFAPAAGPTNVGSLQGIALSSLDNSQGVDIENIGSLQGIT